MADAAANPPGKPTVFVISEGTGHSANVLTRTALNQFVDPPRDLEVVVIPHVNNEEKLQEAIESASAQTNVTVVHTLKSKGLQDQLDNSHVVSTNVLFPLQSAVSTLLGRDRAEESERLKHHAKRTRYFQRVTALQFALEHDDGKRPHELHLADVIICGVSRVGKTPLCLYLASRGMLVANVSMVDGIEPPDELYAPELKDRVVGLVCDEVVLSEYRKNRAMRVKGMSAKTKYDTPAQVERELNWSKFYFRKGGFHKVDTTHKSVEEVATEVLTALCKELPQ